MKDNLDKNIKSLMELAPEQAECPQEMRDKIFADVQKKLREDDEQLAKPEPKRWSRLGKWVFSGCSSSVKASLWPAS